MEVVLLGQLVQPQVSTPGQTYAQIGTVWDLLYNECVKHLSPDACTALLGRGPMYYPSACTEKKGMSPWLLLGIGFVVGKIL